MTAALLAEWAQLEMSFDEADRTPRPALAMHRVLSFVAACGAAAYFPAIVVCIGSWWAATLGKKGFPLVLISLLHRLLPFAL